ncbi:MAG: hypothetical protein HC914_04630 [Chloroflexaceae bacterium]|nr:hypothetical protein [Chloroflexaceae bacterium]
MQTVAFSPDGQLLAAGTHDGTVRVWRLADGTPLHTLTGHDGPVQSMVFHPAGDWLAVSAGTPRIWLWQVSDGQLLTEMNTGSIAIDRLLFAPDGQSLFSTSITIDSEQMRSWPLPAR